MKSKKVIEVYRLNNNLYEQALIWAREKSRNSEDPWADFIDNLSYICDAFASNRETSPIQKSKPYLKIID